MNMCYYMCVDFQPAGGPWLLFTITADSQNTLDHWGLSPLPVSWTSDWSLSLLSSMWTYYAPLLCFCSFLVRYPYCCVYEHNLSQHISLLCCWTLTIWNLHGTDTSRHYQPVESIKRVIDSMSFAKLVSSLAHDYDQFWVVMHVSCTYLVSHAHVMNCICHSCKIWLLSREAIWLVSDHKFSGCTAKLTDSSLCEILLLPVTMRWISSVSKSWPWSLILRYPFGCSVVPECTTLAHCWWGSFSHWDPIISRAMEWCIQL